ncbi:hypothetical protein A3A60_01355 [Candidatus Curtissbacteria bacterium RIFCSPLOWO2_01_FULL_42_26]|uniref:Uncharacterized protein n=1 Tax=Candidatus Curtissbacteria bacterium RIFCSPLOWO2_01_FULL_42_26 TaxID=1797729 RepID=A0A1F5HYP6_9BACT|nr:MAG: hypothetical protein A3A60_01355 [Candidatus Curtissbacteria bacterium RIFCSPLOWO2_01_FULL_42_26]
MTSIAKSQSLDFGYLLFSKIADFVLRVSNKLDNSNLGSLKNKLPIFKSKGLIFAVVLVILVGAGIVWVRARSNNDSTANVSDQAYVSEGDKAELNKKFSIAIRSSDGKETGQALVVNVASLQRTERILYKGKPLVSREGKDFIVINIEIENSTNNRLTVRPVDFFRLVADNGKNYAPDIQTDPVKVEPLSSKNTRTIYIVTDGRKNLKFLIGEIKGENKETVEVVI